MTQRQVKVMRLRYAGVCRCGTALAKGQSAGYDAAARKVVCPGCMDTTPGDAATPVTGPPLTADALFTPEAQAARVAAEAALPTGPVEAGDPGASLAKEYHRRKDAREERIRDCHPRIGGLVLALTSEPQSTSAFATGAAGERRIAARLEGDCGAQVLFLHNRKLGRGRRDGDVDHIAVAPSGVYVIDAKNYRGATVEVRTSGGLFTERVQKLYVAGRDRSNLLAGLTKQRLAVAEAMGSHRVGLVTDITAALCFVDATLPMFGTLRIEGVPILGPRGTGKMLRQPGLLTAADRESLHRHLATHLPPAA